MSLEQEKKIQKSINNLSSIEMDLNNSIIILKDTIDRAIHKKEEPLMYVIKQVEQATSQIHKIKIGLSNINLKNNNRLKP